MKKKIHADNRGMTLVELIVAISISMIILGSIWQFIITSTKTYSSQKDNVDLQVEVQQTMNHLQNLFVDANRSVAYLIGGQEVANDSAYENAADATAKSINIYSDNKVSKIEWNKDTKQIVYHELKVTNGNVETPAAPAAEENGSALEAEVLAEGVTAFAADVSKVESDGVVKVDLTFEKGSVSYEASREITLRNKLLASNTPSVIYKNDTLPNGVVSVALQIVPNQEVTLAQRSSYDFSATINGVTAGDMKVMWTIGNQTSRDTSIDIESGKISIGTDETPGNTITVTATLASDHRVKASTTVKVLQAVPTITIVKSPKYVLRGTSYASSIATGRPIQVKIENAEEEYTLSVSESAVRAGIRVDGSTVVIPNKFNGEVGPWFQFELTATTVATPQSSASVYMTVRNPEFDVVASPSGITTGEYMRGQEVTLSADWSDSAVVMKETIGSTEVVYEEAVYDVTELNKTEIAWTYEYETQAGETKTVAIASGNKFYVPLDIKASGATIKVVGVSKTYENTEDTQNVKFIKAEKVLSVSNVGVSFEAEYEGTQYQQGSTISNVFVGKKIQLEGIITLYTDPRIVWTIYQGSGSNKEITDLLTVHTMSNTKEKAYVLVDNAQRDLIYGETFTVRVSDDNSGLYQEIVFTVQNYEQCQISAPETGKTYTYLVNSNSVNTAKSFMLPLAAGVVFPDKQDGEWYGLNNNQWTKLQVEQQEPVETETSSVNNTVTFKPASATGEGVSYMYHLDSEYTGEHLISVALIRQNSNIAMSGRDFYLPYVLSNMNDDFWDNRGSIKNYNYKYINFYGDNRDLNDSPSYTVNYSYDTSHLGLRWHCYITVTLQDGTQYTEHYQARSLNNHKWEEA